MECGICEWGVVFDWFVLGLYFYFLCLVLGLNYCGWKWVDNFVDWDGGYGGRILFG